MLDKVTSNLKDVDQWVREAPEPASFSSEDAMMKVLVEQVMPRTLWLLQLAASLAPGGNQTGHTKHRAIIVGHMVRLAKLFQGFCQHISMRQVELAGIFIRLIYETEIRLQYFLQSKNKRKALRSFILVSYRPARDILVDLNTKRRKRRLTPIEQRIRNSVMRQLRRDGITFKELLANRNWKADGKDLRAMLRDLNAEWEYSYGFGSSSRWVHGDWLEMKVYHLSQNDARYLPDLEFGLPDPRAVAPMIGNTLGVLPQYLSWAGVDESDEVRRIAIALANWVAALDAEHEIRFRQQAS